MNALETKHLRSFVNPIFFFLLTLLIGLSFAFDMEFYAAAKESFSNFYPYVLSVSIFLGGAFVFLNKKKINEIFEKDRADNERACTRSLEFHSIYPRLNKIPIVRLIARIMYREGWGYAVAFIAIVILSIVIFSHDLGEIDFQGDEYLVVSASEGYLRTGTFYQWDYLNNTLSDTRYERAWPHTWMIAQSYKLFGVSEWSSRIVSVIFGVFFIIIFYFITNFFLQNRLASLLTLFCMLLHPSYIRLFRYTRMYAVLIPIFILLYFFLYRFITEKNKYHLRKLPSFLNHRLNFNYLFILPSLLLLMLNYHIHINAMVILPITFIFVIFLAVYLREKKYIILSSAGGIAGALLAGALLLIGAKSDFKLISLVANNLTFFSRRTFSYIDFLAEYPFNGIVSFSLLVPGLFLIFFTNKKESTARMVYLYIAVIFSLIFFIFVADRYSRFKYISHIIPIAIMLIVYMMVFFSRISGKKSVTALFSILLVCGVLNCNKNFETRLGGLLYPKYSRYKSLDPVDSYPSIAYQTLIDQYDPQNEVIFANRFRTYYLRDIGRIVRHIDMLEYNQYKFKTFWKDINTYGEGWVVFELDKIYHLDKKLLAYVNKFFKKYHGVGVDDTNIEMFYFNREMIRLSVVEINKIAQEHRQNAR